MRNERPNHKFDRCFYLCNIAGILRPCNIERYLHPIRGLSAEGTESEQHPFTEAPQAAATPTTEAVCERNLSADIFCDSTGKKWSAVVREHPANGGPGLIIWEKHGISTEHNAITAMEAAWGKFQSSTGDAPITEPEIGNCQRVDEQESGRHLVPHTQFVSCAYWKPTTDSGERK